jgi:hypothetical protein
MAIQETSEEGIIVVQDSEAILNNDSGFDRQLQALDTLAPARSPRLINTGFSSPSLSPLMGSDSLQVPDTSGYRFPAVASTERRPDSPTTGIPPATQSTQVARTQSGGKDIQRSETGLSDGSVAGADLGLWEALAATDPSGHKDGEVDNYLNQGRRMSASEENRRASYLMIAYPLAVSSILT